MPKLSVIVLTYNSEKHIGDCLRSVLEQRNTLNMDGFKTEIVVVDNKSEDGTASIVKEFENVVLIENKNNVGFSAGVNRGVKSSFGDMVLLLNPDARLKRRAIKQLIFCLTESGSGIAGGKSLRPNGSVYGSYVRQPGLAVMLFDYSNLRKILPGDFVHKHHYYENESFFKSFKFVDAVSGAFMLIDRSVFKKVGYFDEKFFMYLEDVDFCLRAKKAGFKVVYCPKSTIIHVGGASSPNRDKIHYVGWKKSRKYYARKHFSFLQNCLIQPIFWLDDLAVMVWRLLRR